MSEQRLWVCRRCEETQEHDDDDQENVGEEEAEFWCDVCNDFRYFDFGE